LSRQYSRIGQISRRKTEVSVRNTGARYPEDATIRGVNPARGAITDFPH
jgi:hypothetical protein